MGALTMSQDMHRPAAGLPAGAVVSSHRMQGPVQSHRHKRARDQDFRSAQASFDPAISHCMRFSSLSTG